MTKWCLDKGNALDFYNAWLKPTCIISDGPYGLGLFPGEPINPDGLAEWYAPHAAAWAERALPHTTLWFWNSEIGWAKSHPALELHGWHYEETIIWDKGLSHIAGKVNSKTIRGMPVVTEIAVRYTRKVSLPSPEGKILSLKEWVRQEWMRSGLPMSQANEACGVRNAATRKYLTQCHLWYFPPGEAIVAMSQWCEKYGQPTSRPYFSLDGIHPPSVALWEDMRAKWNHVHGMTNVWFLPPVHGPERIKAMGSKTIVAHANQKPLSLMERQIVSSSDPGNVIWEPFGGLCSASVAAISLDRQVFAAEVNPDFYTIAKHRLQIEENKQKRML
jgi:DNA methylase